MKSGFYIDGIDIAERYGIIPVDGWYNDMLLVPPLGEPDKNDWPEYDGTEPDLSDPVLSNKSVSVQFASVTGNNRNIDDFLSFITKPGYRIIASAYMDRTWKVRASDEQNRSVYMNGQAFTVQFADDFQHSLKSDAQPSGHGLSAPKQGYYLDGVPLGDYGVVILEGTKSEIFKMPAVKESLTVKSKYLNGVKYDADIVRFKAKEVTLRCAFYCDTTDRFRDNYAAFFSKLTEPYLRQLYVDYAYEEFSCYYKNTSDFSFIKNTAAVACRFNLTLIFTDCRPKTSVYVWGSEDGRIIATEDNINAIIYK